MTTTRATTNTHKRQPQKPIQSMARIHNNITIWKTPRNLQMHLLEYYQQIRPNHRSEHHIYNQSTPTKWYRIRPVAESNQSNDTQAG